jgi:hypothetical protein
MGNETLNTFTLCRNDAGSKRSSRDEYAYRQSFLDGKRKDRNLDRTQSA